MLEEKDLIQIGELVTAAIDSAIEKQDKRTEEMIDRKLEEKLEEKLEQKFNQKLEPIELRIAAIQEHLLHIDQRLDRIEARLNNHIKGNDEDIAQIYKDLDIERKRIDLVEKQCNTLSN